MAVVVLLVLLALLVEHLAPQQTPPAHPRVVVALALCSRAPA
jgi:hypothetical protein